MSIVAYTGLPGAGKSYGVVEHVILPAIKKSRTLYTNIPLNDEILQRDFGDFNVLPFDVHRAMNEPGYFDSLEGGAIILIDEAWRIWPTGKSASKIPEEQRSFFAEHRHKVGDDGYSQEIVLCTQSLTQISKFVRDLIDETYISTKLDKLGFDKRFRVNVYSGAQNTDKPDKTKFVNQYQGSYKEDVYQYYKSHTKATNEGAVGIEQKLDSRATIWKGVLPKLIIGLLVLIFSFWFLFTKFLAPPKPKNQPQGSPNQSIPSAPFPSRFEPTYRVIGDLLMNNRWYVYIKSNDSAPQRIIDGYRHCNRDFFNITCRFKGNEIDQYSGDFNSDYNNYSEPVIPAIELLPMLVNFSRFTSMPN